MVNVTIGSPRVGRYFCGGPTIRSELGVCRGSGGFMQRNMSQVRSAIQPPKKYRGGAAMRECGLFISLRHSRLCHRFTTDIRLHRSGDEAFFVGFVMHAVNIQC